MSNSEIIETLCRARDERRSKGTDITHTENELVEAIALTCPKKKEHAHERAGR